jgi:hypothetical protein
LTQPLLQAICQEITEYLGQIDNKHQFARTFPKLTKFLNEYPVVGLNNSDQWLEKLESVSRQIEVVLRMGQSYTGELSEFVQVYLLGKDYEAQLKREAKSAEIDELDQYIESTKLKHGQKNKLNQNERFTKEGAGENAMPDSNVLNKQLQGFLSLQQSYIEAQRLVTLFHETKELMMRSISLPVSESDLLMRYQTTLERRLSQAIGELLALQKAEK